MMFTRKHFEYETFGIFNISRVIMGMFGVHILARIDDILLNLL